MSFSCCLRALVVALLVVALLVGGPAFAINEQSDPPQYFVNSTGTAPVIDGVVSLGEWDSAEPSSGTWVNLRAHTPDSHNLRFQVLYDNAGL